MINYPLQFADYVWDFYSPKSDLYPIKGLTIKDVYDAIDVYLSRIESNNNDRYTWGDGDSLDRERVRDIILESPQFTFGG